MNIVRCPKLPPKRGLKNAKRPFPRKIALQLKKVCYKFLSVNTVSEKVGIDWPTYPCKNDSRGIMDVPYYVQSCP